MSTPLTAGGATADRIADAVLGCPGVAALHGGRFGEIATYLPRRRVAGVRVHQETNTTEVHVVGRYPSPVPEIARQVRTALRPLVGDARVDVVVGDYAGETESAPVRPSTSTPATGELDAPPATTD